MKKILFIFMFLLSFFGYAQFGPEGFEATTGPTALPSTNWTLGTGNWAVFDNGVGVGQRWGINSTVSTPPIVFSGTNSAYINRENVGIGNTSEDYLATPLVTIPSNGQLRFYARTFTNNNQGTTYFVRTAPATASQTNPAAYTTLVQYTEDELTLDPEGIQNPFNVYTEKVINFPVAMIGTQIHIAFVMRTTQTGTVIGGDRFLLDNVRVVSNCIDPTNLTANNITDTSASLSWSENNSATSWEIEIVPTSANPTNIGVIYNGTIPYVKTGLTPNTSYKYFIRSLCGGGINSAWVGPLTFTTYPPIVAPILTGCNTIVGSFAANNATVDNSTLIGCEAGSESNGSFNSFFGIGSGKSSIGNSNTFIGNNSGTNTQGSYNSFLGNTAGLNSNGSKNTYIGYKSGSSIIGNNNIFLTSQDVSLNQLPSYPNLDSKLIIESKSYIRPDRGPFIYGDFTARTLDFNVDINSNSFVKINAPTSSNRSGLRFSQLNSASTTSIGNGKVLSLDANGEVILVNDGGSGGGTITANNAITATGSNVQLGGALTQNTDLTGTFNLNLTQGNLGIGTSTPGNRVHIDAASGTSGLRLSGIPAIATNQFLTTTATGDVVLQTIPTAIGTNTVGAINGLSATTSGTNTNIGLGGTLSAATTINTAGNSLSFTGAGNFGFREPAEQFTDVFINSNWSVFETYEINPPRQYHLLRITNSNDITKLDLRPTGQLGINRGALLRTDFILKSQTHLFSDNAHGGVAFNAIKIDDSNDREIFNLRSNGNLGLNTTALLRADLAIKSHFNTFSSIAEGGAPRNAINIVDSTDAILFDLRSNGFLGLGTNAIQDARLTVGLGGRIRFPDLVTTTPPLVNLPRMVVVGTDGTLSSQVIPSGGGTITNNLTSNIPNINTMTSTVNGTVASAPIINSVSNTIISGELQTTVNGVSSIAIPLPDASVTNELQNLTLTGNTLAISSGNSIDLPKEVYTIGSSDTPESIRVSNSSNSALLDYNHDFINEAINVALTNGFIKIYIQEGRYKVNETINLSGWDNITIEGAGTATLIHPTNTTGFYDYPIINLGGSGKSRRNIIKNLSLLTKNTIDSNEVQAAIKLQKDAQFNIFQNIYFGHVVGNTHSSAPQILIELKNNQTMTLDSDSNQFENFYMYRCHYGIKLDIDQSGVFNHNTFSNFHLGEFIIGVDFGTNDLSSITDYGCTIEGNLFSNFDCQAKPEEATNVVKNIRGTNNTFQNFNIADWNGDQRQWVFNTVEQNLSIIPVIRSERTVIENTECSGIDNKIYDDIYTAWYKDEGFGTQFIDNANTNRVTDYIMNEVSKTINRGISNSSGIDWFSKYDISQYKSIKIGDINLSSYNYTTPTNQNPITNPTLLSNINLESNKVTKDLIEGVIQIRPQNSIKGVTMSIDTNGILYKYPKFNIGYVLTSIDEEGTVKWMPPTTSATTNILTSSNNAISSNVNGVIATLTPPSGTIATGKVLGFNSSGGLVVGSDIGGSTYTGSTSIILTSNSFQRAALTGDVTAAQNSNATIIAANAVTTGKILDGTIANVDLAAGVGGIYKGSGTLSSATTVTQGTNSLTFNSAGINTLTVGNGRVFIGGNTGLTSSTFNGYNFMVNGKAWIKTEVNVQTSTAFPDYVFNKDYKLKSLSEVENFIKENGKLPNMPSAKEIETNGLPLADMTTRQQEKIEELTLYAIDQDKKVSSLQAELEKQKQEMEQLKKLVNQLLNK